MAKSTELRVDIDPTLRDRVRKEAKRIEIRMPLLIELALLQFLERADTVASLRHEIGDALAAQAVVNAKIEYLAGFVADVTAVSDAASSARSGVEAQKPQA